MPLSNFLIIFKELVRAKLIRLESDHYGDIKYLVYLFTHPSMLNSSTASSITKIKSKKVNMSIWPLSSDHSENWGLIPDQGLELHKIWKLIWLHRKLVDNSNHQVHQTFYLFGPKPDARTTKHKKRPSRYFRFQTQLWSKFSYKK